MILRIWNIDEYMKELKEQEIKEVRINAIYSDKAQQSIPYRTYIITLTALKDEKIIKYIEDLGCFISVADDFLKDKHNQALKRNKEIREILEKNNFQVKSGEWLK